MLLLSVVLLCLGGKARAFHPYRYAHQPADSVILFRFVPGKLMFYSPFAGNEDAIAEAGRLIETHREDIAAGRACIVVRGFCGSYPTEAENLRAAKNRSNQVKSYFITHYGMKEDCYRTQNSTRAYRGSKDVVAIIGLEYAPGFGPAPAVTPEPEPAPAPEPVCQQADTVAAPLAAATDTLPERQTAVTVADAPVAIPVERQWVNTPWYIKTNLVYDLALMPSLEVEYRINDRWSAAVEGNMAWWHRDSKHRYYQLATIIPEARYWFRPQGHRRGHYVGLFGGGGWYDLENGGRGYKGEGGLVGISYGYQFPVGKHFAFEAGVGVGFMTTKYEEYLPIDGHYVYQQTSRTNFFGPLKLKFAFVWNIGRWTEKGGRK